MSDPPAEHARPPHAGWEQVKAIIEACGQTPRMLTFPRQFLTLTNGNLNATLMLAQLVYWTDKTSDPDGWVYKSAPNWEAELDLSEYQVRNAWPILERIGVEKVVRQTRSGAPTSHYRINWDRLEAALKDCLGSNTEPQPYKQESRTDA